jgi:uncharacterized surface protein with fasciclin (FAS1) repeats
MPSRRLVNMNPFAVAAIAGVVMVGAGAGAITSLSSPAPEPSAEIMNPMIDGQAMLPVRDISDNLTYSPEHSVLTVYLKETDLDRTLKEKGPFTIFAATDKAFTAAGNLGSREDVTKLVDYEIVRGKLDSKTLLAMIGEGGGRARLRTLEGGVLVATLNGPTNIQLMDEKGQTADISIYDIYAKNGVIQVVDRVTKPADFGRKPVLTSSAR